MGELYHGSNIKGLKVLHTHQSTHGKYVYATPHKGLALLFSGIAGDDLTYTIFRNGKKEPWNIVERVLIAFKTMFSNNASLYTVSDEKFEDIHTGICELVSKEDVSVLKEEEITLVYEKLINLEKDGFIKMYHYPERPSVIPENDEDLIQVEINACKRFGEELNKTSFERLLLLHPALLNKVNEVGLRENPNFETFSKYDIKNIFAKFIIKKMLYPEKELFLESARINIIKEFPEFSEFIDACLSVLPTSKE